MQKISIDELKKIQINILDAAVDFCEKWGINYWLDCGTLLGAVRHQGYIPWDDDIDIGMLRPDFDRFMELFNRSNERYQAYCIETNSKFYYGHGKVLDTETVLYEPNEKGIKLSVNIDIFVYDNAPNDNRKIEITFKKRDLYRNLNLLRTLNHRPNGSLMRRLYIYFLRGMVKPFPKSFFVKKQVLNSKKYNHINTDLVGNFLGHTKMCCDKKIFSSFIKIKFENKYYKAPAGYDEYLRAFYGNYMELPPIEKRVTHHIFTAYINESVSIK